MKLLTFIIYWFLLGSMASGQLRWEHISSKTGAIEPPNAGKQQTSCAVADFDNDGINDFCISERTTAPGLVWYQRTADGWTKHVVDDAICYIEAGTTTFDVDGDGDMDIIAGGESKTNQVWWWENPYPDFSRPWPRHIIRNTGGNKVHDQMTGDFDGDFKPDLVFWAQGDQTLYFTRIPEDPELTENWKLIPVYKYYSDSQMEQHGTYPSWKRTNEHEGLAKADIDGDGVQDIIGGGLWFKYLGNDKFSVNVIDAAYTFSRMAAGQIIPGGRPEVVMVVGDGLAPMFLYQYDKGIWKRKEILPSVSNGHTLAVVDFDGDGKLDIWYAEMTLGGHQEAVNRILFGDGKGNFPRFLYEGPSGGSFVPEKSYWQNSSSYSILRNTPDHMKGERVTGNWKWVIFGRDDIKSRLFVIHQTVDEKTDSFSYMGSTGDGIQASDGMTVFGFGRSADSKPLLYGNHKFAAGITYSRKQPKKNSSKYIRQKMW